MIQPHLNLEKEVWDAEGLAAGVDEVGKGCLAGPVVAAAVIFPPGAEIHKKIRDSKTMTQKSREEMFEYILENCHDFGIGLATAEEINENGINPATQRAMVRALKGMKTSPDLVLVDAVEIVGIPQPQKAVIKGDAHIYSIAAASVVAKVFRDAIVSGFDNVYPDYKFSSHKGYGTKVHQEAIVANGLTPEHRTLFCRKFV